MQLRKSCLFWVIRDLTPKSVLAMSAIQYSFSTFLKVKPERPEKSHIKKFLYRNLQIDLTRFKISGIYKDLILFFKKS